MVIGLQYGLRQTLADSPSPSRLAQLMNLQCAIVVVKLEAQMQCRKTLMLGTKRYLYSTVEVEPVQARTERM